MKQGIALFLLYFYDGEWNRQGIRAMAERGRMAMGFSAASYGMGLKEMAAGDDLQLFRQLFYRWRSMTEMDPGIRQEALGKIEALLRRRTDGIMEANRRKYYGECAAMIAALGEVKEFLGETGAKQRLMNLYRQRYPRRRAFHNAMRSLG